MVLKSKIRSYLQLARIQTGAATASAPLTGALLAGRRDLLSLIIVFAIGILFHIYGFVLNEYLDREIDRKSKHHSHKPLVKGSIPAKHALIIGLGSCFCSCLVIAVFFPGPVPFLFLLGAILSGGLYNLFGKKIPGMDFLLGTSFFFICLSGAGTIAGPFNSLTFIVCAVYFVQIVFNNAVEGGIKDIEFDILAGSKTMAIKMNVSFANGKLKTTVAFLFFAYVLRIIFYLLIGLIVFNGEMALWLSNIYLFSLIILICLIIVTIITLFKFLYVTLYNRAALKKLFSIHEIASYSAFMTALLPFLTPVIVLFLIFLPLLWFIFFNIILYGKPLEPDI